MVVLAQIYYLTTSRDVEIAARMRRRGKSSLVSCVCARLLQITDLATSCPFGTPKHDVSTRPDALPHTPSAIRIHPNSVTGVSPAPITHTHTFICHTTTGSPTGTTTSTSAITCSGVPPVSSGSPLGPSPLGLGSAITKTTTIRVPVPHVSGTGTGTTLAVHSGNASASAINLLPPTHHLPGLTMASGSGQHQHQHQHQHRLRLRLSSLRGR